MSSTARVYWLAITLIGFAKLLLIGDLEIHGDMFDDHGYALSASMYYWGVDSRANWLFIRPPGFPLFGSLVMVTGLPYRIGIELFFIGGAAWFCSSLLQAGITRLVSVVIFCAIIFHPFSYSMFNAYLSEPLYLSLNLVMLGALIRLIVADRLHVRTFSLWVAGITLGWLLLTRREGPLIYGVFLAFAGLRFVWVRFVLGHSWPQIRNLVWLLLPILIAQVGLLSVRTVNYAKWGIFATNEQEAPGFTRLLNALYSIDAPDASRYAPVTRMSLQMAMDASPRFRALEAAMLDTRDSNVIHGERLTGRDGELGPWMWWRLYGALAATGIYTSPEAADAWMQAAAEEIENALSSGALPEHRLQFPFPLDPNFRFWIMHLPHEIWSAMQRLWGPSTRYDWRNRDSIVPERYRDAFDTAGNRRRSHLSQNMMRLYGHVVPRDGPADFITVETPDGTVVATAPILEVHQGMLDSIREVTGKDELFPTSFVMRSPAVEARDLDLIVWQNGNPIERQSLREVEKSYWSGYPRDTGRNCMLTIEKWENPRWQSSRDLRVFVSGWAAAPTAQPDHVSLINASGQLLKHARFTVSRPDIESIYESIEGTKPEGALGFEIFSPTLDTQQIFLEFWHKGQRVHRIALNPEIANTWENLPAADSGVRFVYGIDQVVLPKSPGSFQSVGSEIRDFFAGIAAGDADRIRNAQVRQAIRDVMYATYGFCIVAVSLLCIIASGTPGRRFIWLDCAKENWTTCAILGIAPILLGVLIIGRGIFYGLVEAIVVPGEARYVESAAPIASAWCILTAILIAAVVQPWIQKIRQSDLVHRVGARLRYCCQR